MAELKCSVHHTLFAHFIFQRQSCTNVVYSWAHISKELPTIKISVPASTKHLDHAYVFTVTFFSQLLGPQISVNNHRGFNPAPVPRAPDWCLHWLCLNAAPNQSSRLSRHSHIPILLIPTTKQTNSHHSPSLSRPTTLDLVWPTEVEVTMNNYKWNWSWSWTNPN